MDYTHAQRQSIIAKSREIVRLARQLRHRTASEADAADSNRQRLYDGMLEMERQIEVNRAADAHEQAQPARAPFDGRSTYQG